MRPPLGELNFHRLLVAIDGSDSADLALTAAVTAARRDNAAITLISVAPDMSAQARWPVAGAPLPQQLQEDADKEANQTLREAVERIPDDIPVTTIFRHGRAGEQIVKASKEDSYDAVLMGARGLGRVSALMGSVSSYVMHHAPVAVFVAHAPKADE